MKKITVLGGGTGTYVVLTGLRKYPLDLGVIVTMMDSGGSTGRLRDQLGVLPPGDLRQCLVALSEAPLLWRKLFLYRFEKGDLKGHNFGNIFLSALEKVSENYGEVLDTANFVLRTKGEVMPVTFEQTHLLVKYDSGRVVKGEGKIDENNLERTKIVGAYLEPLVKANQKAVKRILDSDYIIIGPGDLYTSILPIVLVPEIKVALGKTRAKIFFITNLMTKLGQATDYKASDYLADIYKYIGRKIDLVIINNGQISKEAVNWYKEYQEIPVKNDLKSTEHEIIEADLIDRKEIIKETQDVLKRSILRHDSDKLAQVLIKLLI